MRCLNDKNIIEEENIELPMLKDSKEDKSDLKEANIKEENIKIEEEAFESEKSIQYRKGLLKKAVVFSLIVIVLFVAIIFVVRSSSDLDKNPSNVFDVTQVNKVLNSYKNTKEENGILELLDIVKNDDENKNKVQAETYEVFNYWLTNIDVNNYSNYDEFYNDMEGYRNLLNGIYKQFVYSVSNIEVKMLKQEDYTNLKNVIDNNKSMGKNYYDGLDLYKDNDYNEAYEKFMSISNDNIFYEKANNYKIEIENIIIGLIENDIKNLENNIDFLDEEQKRERYLQIVVVINAYKDVYSKVNLAENTRYIEIFNEYNSYVG